MGRNRKKKENIIHVKNCFGETFTMKVHEHDTISSIKNMIFEKHNIPHDHQNIIFSDSRPGDLSDIPKLEDAKLAGTEHSKECTLILTKGDSAKSLVASQNVGVREEDGVVAMDVMLQNIESDLRDLKKTRDFVELVRSQTFNFTKDSKDLEEFFMGHNIDAVSLESLLSLPLSTFLNEGLKKLEDKIQDKEEEKNALFDKTETQLWEDDLKVESI